MTIPTINFPELNYSIYSSDNSLLAEIRDYSNFSTNNYNTYINEVQSNLVNAIIEMAHILGLNVVAEGIEEIEQQDRLLESSCDLLQGYYISKPLPTEQAVNFLKCVQAV